MQKLAIVVSVLLLTAVTAQANLITDGGFDNSGDLLGMGSNNWVEATFTAASADPAGWFSNSPGLSVANGVVGTSVDGLQLFQLIQDAGLAQGQTITMSFDVVSASTSNMRIYLMSRAADDPDDGTVSMTGGAIQSTAASAYLEVTAGSTGSYSIDYVLPDAYSVLGIRVTGLAGGVALDNFNLTPEPTTLAVLGMGGLALLRRRR